MVWDPGQRLTFTLTGSNTPGLHSMVEDWAAAPHPRDPTDPTGPADPARTLLTVRVGIEAAGILRPFPGLVRAIMSGPLKGAAGITTQSGSSEPTELPGAQAPVALSAAPPSSVAPATLRVTRVAGDKAAS